MERNYGQAMDRRSFLKLTAAGSLALALGPLRTVFSQESLRDLVVVSNGGDAAAGIDPSVSVIDPERLEVLVTVPLSSSYSFPATRWDFERDLIWSGGPNEAVHAWRLSTGEQVLELPTGSSQNYTELTPDGRHLVVAARFADRYLKVVADPDSDDFGEVVAEVDAYEGASPCDVTITSDGRFGYFPERGGDTLATLRMDPFERVSRIPVRSSGEVSLEPYMATASPTGNVLLVENAGPATGSESILDLTDPSAPAEVARLSSEDGLGERPLTSEVTPDGRYGVVICRDTSELSIIDIERREVIGSVALPDGSNPLTGTFVFGGNGDCFFVPLPGRDAVAVVGVPEFVVTELIPVGARPLGVVHLRTGVPRRAEAGQPLGAAIDQARSFPAGCPDRCCGPV